LNEAGVIGSYGSTTPSIVLHALEFVALQLQTNLALANTIVLQVEILKTIQL